MWVRLLTARITAEGWAQTFGDIIEVSDADGRRMLAAGQCTPAEKPNRETAMNAFPARGASPERATRKGNQ